MNFTVVVHARTGQQFTRQVFEAMIDDEVTIKSDFGKSYTGRLVGAEVASNGQSAHITLDLADDDE